MIYFIMRNVSFGDLEAQSVATTRSQVVFRVLVLVIVTAILSYIHLRIPASQGTFHIVLRRLYYIPIIVAASLYGKRWGLACASVVVISFIPHLIQVLRMGDLAMLFESLSDIPVFLVAGIVPGVLSDRERARRRQAEHAQLETVERLAMATEWRDSDTGSHLLRIGLYTQALALCMGMSKEEATRLRYASTLHDVGKIGIPDSILLKPGRLSTAEYDQIKQHTRMGYDLLTNARSELLQLAAEIALNHHERWDGSGYPNGISGQSIPLAARLVSVADVFDALVSRRPYKEPMPVAEAVAELQRESARSFDPAVLDCFVDNLPKFKTILEEHR
jgi:HD-GYP domain-containing protein (c-di-GMP phosphodiesterase class II)